MQIQPNLPHDEILRELTQKIAAQLHDPSTAPTPRVLVFRQTYYLPDPGVWLSLALERTHAAWYRRDLNHATNLANDPVDRMNLYASLEEWVLRRGLVIPLANATVAFAVKPYVSGMQVTPFGLMPDNGTWNTVDVS